jgi:class 3 adenylate cyclase/tetratricopeptide (TPR) repeat protein
VTCPACRADVRPGLKFCPSCGTRLAMVCPACSAPAEVGARFCGECGTDLQTAQPAAATTAPAAAQPGIATGAQSAATANTTTGNGTSASVSERRVVSVLFADLVGFTPLSEGLDPEEVRELLSRYFDVARQVIGRYGGIVEKFIGDAVMAVWGTPTAREDDAERAVRAALELVAAIPAIAAGAGDLRVRAGVVTGEVAVTIGAEGQGLAAGDVVNTASRIQSVAPPGGVLVDDATQRATEQPIAYEDAGVRDLKGKAEPVHVWQAMRVVAGIRGASRTAALEPPFVGRDGELRLVKELFHNAVAERRARFVSVTGAAGVGKSRLGWEFDKYVDGLAEEVLWHHGRCLSYGEGVTYWALAEMVRMRADIGEGDEPQVALGKLRRTVQQYVDDVEEQRWLEPRLAHLLGIEDRSASDSADLFSAWRLFFEKLATREPTVMVFEDLQWADSGLLDFIEYLLDWSRGFPLFVLTLSRPELTDRRPIWGSGKRNFTSIYLEPLPAAAMDDLLAGLVPGLPADLRRRIEERAEGIPLYAVETVRMLLGKGLLRPEGRRFVLAGKVGDLDVPETLHALIAARLDALAPPERELLQVAAVLGQNFTAQRVAAFTGQSEIDVQGLLASLVRKEFLSVQSDPLSPERGQFGFLQALMRKVAYDTLPKRERKQRHLRAAHQLESSGAHDADEITEVVASHYVEAFRAAPDDADATEIRTHARRALERAGQRAASLAASEDALRYFEQAAELAEEPLVRAELLERAGEMAQRSGRTDAAVGHFEAAIELFNAQQRTHPAARVSARLGEEMWNQGKLEEAVERMATSYGVLAAEEPDADLAVLAAQLGRFEFFVGRTEAATGHIEAALDIAEALQIPEVLSQALNTKHLLLATRGHRAEGLALLKHAVDVALEGGASAAALRGYYNLADRLCRLDKFDEALAIEDRALVLARQRGDHFWEWQMASQKIYPLYALGRWSEALQLAGEIASPQHGGATGRVILVSYVLPGLIHASRGRPELGRELLAVAAELETSADLQDRAAFCAISAVVLRAEGRNAEAVQLGEAAFESIAQLGPGESVQEGHITAVDAALALGDLATAERLVERATALRDIDRTRYHSAHLARFSARLAAQRGRADDAEPQFRRAVAVFRELSVPYGLAVTLLEYAEWLTEERRAEEVAALLREARGIFEYLEAPPMLRRLGHAELAAGIAPPPSRPDDAVPAAGDPPALRVQGIAD